jgi:dGTPase
LAEAADDICNTIIDYEDGYKSGIISFKSLHALFSAIAKNSYPEINMAGLKKIKCDREKAGYLRSKAIYSLTMKTVELFQTHENEFLAGTFKECLSNHFKQYDSWKTIRKESMEKLYNNQQVLVKEIAGFEVIPGLLKTFLSASKDPKTTKHQKILKLLPSEFNKNFEELQYEAIMDITTYVCGMTDGFAVDTYRKLTGMEI